jgi:predicted permease
MEILIDIVLPVFGLMLVGFVATQFRLFSADAARGLSLFVFNFAIPVLLFRSVSQAKLPDPFEWDFVLTYYLGCAGTWLIGFVISRLIFRHDFTAATLAGMTGGFANTVMLGIPLVLTAYGEAGAVPLFIIISLHSLILVGSATVLIEAGRGDRRKLLFIPLNIARGLVTNPIIIALLLGAIANRIGLPIPRPIAQTADMLAAAALPCAVFSMGASLAAYKLQSALLPASTWTVLKLVVHPALVYLLGRYVFEVPTLWRDVAVVIAALPVGINVYLIAQRHNTGQAAAASALVLSAALSFGSVAVIMNLLGIQV